MSTPWEAENCPPHALLALTAWPFYKMPVLLFRETVTHSMYKAPLLPHILLRLHPASQWPSPRATRRRLPSSFAGDWVSSARAGGLPAWILLSPMWGQPQAPSSARVHSCRKWSRSQHQSQAHQRKHQTKRNQIAKQMKPELGTTTHLQRALALGYEQLTGQRHSKQDF